MQHVSGKFASIPGMSEGLKIFLGWHTSSVERFSENFASSISLECNNFENVIFEKIPEPLLRSARSNDDLCSKLIETGKSTDFYRIAMRIIVKLDTLDKQLFPILDYDNTYS